MVFKSPFFKILVLYEITIFSGTGRTKHAKAQAEVARRAAETDLFMELRLLNLVGDKNEGNLDDPDKKRKILKWAKVNIFLCES